jgi:hypothetical protein
MDKFLNALAVLSCWLVLAGLVVFALVAFG